MLALAILAALAPAADKVPFAEKGRTHWAFQPLRRPVVPELQGSDPARASIARNPIDAFLLAKLRKEGLEPSAPAPPRTLLRRLHLSLAGLPPTTEETEAFLANPSEHAYRRLVEDLLARPSFGERFGRMWLDLARYADTNGYERDGDKPLAWKYRDWVIAAMNANLPYDRFVREQLAGDELPDSNAARQIATTFLRLGTWDDVPANEGTDRYDQLDDVLGTTAAVFLASTLRCARCHDHKAEPFSQRDYYRLLAVFEPLKRPQKGREDLTYPVGNREEVAAYRAAEASRAAGLSQLTRLDKALQERIRQRHLRDATKKAAVLKSPPRNAAHWLILADDAERRAMTDLANRRKAITTRPLPKMEHAYIWHETGPTAPPTHLLRRGNPNLSGPEVTPGLPTILLRKEPSPPRSLQHSTGRRLWLAEWITSPENPLTARVMANRIWQWHFGTGLVATASDFGLQGEKPTHPELLDWLACELIESGWDMKRLHRLIAQSAAYRVSSAHDGPDAARKLAMFGRWRQRRLEAEAVRDSMMAVSGELFRRMGGPGVYPELPPAVLATQSRPGQGWGKSSAVESNRRSVYVFAKRSLRLPELDLLDLAESTTSCESRPASTTAPQALTLLNGEFSNARARNFAARLDREAMGAEARVRRAYQVALSRPPSRRELVRAVAFLAAQQRLIEKDSPEVKDAGRRALESFCLVLLNSSEFAYLD